VSGASGTFAFAVELYRSGEPEVLAAAGDVDFTFPDRAAVFTFLRDFRELPFRQVGLYEFRLFVRMLRNQAGQPTPDAPRQLLATEPLTMEAFS
jgi:hypothetical protein